MIPVRNRLPLRPMNNPMEQWPWAAGWLNVVLLWAKRLFTPLAVSALLFFGWHARHALGQAPCPCQTGIPGGRGRIMGGAALSVAAGADLDTARLRIRNQLRQGVRDIRPAPAGALFARRNLAYRGPRHGLPPTWHSAAPSCHAGVSGDRFSSRHHFYSGWHGTCGRARRARLGRSRARLCRRRVAGVDHDARVYQRTPAQDAERVSAGESIIRPPRF